MEKEVLRTINKYKLIDRDDIIIVGLSGGADSVSLLLCLNSLSKILGIKKLIGVHINHCLRDTAKRDEEFSKNLCKRLGIEFYSKSVNIKALKEELKVCEEEAGRIARYEFFREIRNKTGATKIATAHNKNDQTETFLMRMLRGGGTDGLASIKPLREDGIIRPLIDTERSTIEKYLSDRGEKYVTDETNLKPDYLRNKIRLELIPYLKESFGLKESIIADSAEALREDSAYLKKEAEKYINEAKTEKERIVFELDALKNMPDAILKRVISLSVARLSGENVLKDNIFNVIRIIRKGETGKKADISKNIEAVTDYDKFIVRNKGIIKEYSYNIKPGKNYIEEIGFTITLSEELSDSKNSINIPEFSTLTVRTRKNGDRMYIENVGNKKLKDIFIDKKISRDERDSFPVVCLDNEIIWLYGLYKRKFKNCKYSIMAEWED